MGDPWTIVGWLVVILLAMFIVVWLLDIIAQLLTY